jgi:hypothetical protein
MAFFASAFKSAARFAVVVAVLGASSLTAAPAFAESFATGFSLQIESSRGFADGQRQDRHNSWDDGYRMRCLTKREVVRGVSAYGYGRVQIVSDYGRDRLGLQAIKGNWLYSMRIDTCTGQVDRLQRIGRASGGHDREFGNGGYRNDHGGSRSHGGSGFQFQFNFGN